MWLLKSICSATCRLLYTLSPHKENFSCQLMMYITEELQLRILEMAYVVGVWDYACKYALPVWEGFVFCCF